MFVDEFVVWVNDFIDCDSIRLFEILNYIFKEGFFFIEVIFRILVFYWCFFDKFVVFDVVEVDGFIICVNCELVKVVMRDEMLVFVCSYFVDRV